MSPSNRFPPTSRLTLALAALLLAPAGVSAAGKLAFAPASLDFGANALGEFKIKTATLKNGTAADIVLGAATLIDNPGGYSIAGTTCGATLPAGQSCKYILLYIAKTLPPAAARLELSTQDPDFPLLKLPLRANLYPALNDTGITRCGDANGNGLPCPVPDFPGQDAQYGRDKTRNAAGNGRAGFNFTKLDSKGKALPAKATAWDCVRDNVTGRVWEKKPKGDGTLGDQGLHDADDTYTWYSTDAGNNRGNKTCFGFKIGQPATFCNTEAYVNRVNAAGWCGYTDWRLPDRFELRGLADLGVTSQAIDTGYFPDAIGTRYWSSSPYAHLANGAWNVDFSDGHSGSDGLSRSSYNAVRLVRGGQ